MLLGSLSPSFPSVVLQIADPGFSPQGCSLAQLPCPQRKNSLNDLDEIFIKAICHFTERKKRARAAVVLSETCETSPTLLKHFFSRSYPARVPPVHAYFLLLFRIAASFVRGGLMPDRVSPVSITPHLLPVRPPNPNYTPSPPLSLSLKPAGKHKTLSAASFFLKSRDCRGRSRGRPPAAHGGQCRPPCPWPPSSPQAGIKSEQTEYFPKLLYRRWVQ